MEIDYEGFSIREYTKNVRSVEVRKCWPFAGDITGERIQSLLPPITVAKFRWWSHELTSLLAKSPVAADDSDPVFHRKPTKSKSRQCKKRSIVEIFAASPKIQSAHREAGDGNDSDVLISSKRKKMKNVVVQKKIKSKKSKDSGDRKFSIKVNKKCREQDRERESSGGVMSLSQKKVGSFTKDQDSEYKIPGILRAKCPGKSLDKSIYDVTQWERHVKFSGDQSEKLSQLKINIGSLELLCSEMNKLSLFSANDKKTAKVISNDQTNSGMQLDIEESRQQNKFQPLVSERRLSTAPRPGPHLSSQGHVAQPYISYSSMHCETSLYQSPFDPLVMDWMQKSVLNIQSQVEETISGFPLNLQGELIEENGEESCRSFDRSGLGICSSGYKHLVEPILAKDGVGKFEKRHNYFPARLGIDESFTENYNDGEFSHQTLHSPVSSLNPRSHTINLSKQDGLNQNLDIRNMFVNSDGLCLQNIQATLRLMGKDVSVGTRYSDMVKTREMIIEPDASSFLGNSEIHSTEALDKNWNRSLLQDISKDLFRRFCESHNVVVPDLEFPPIVLNPCCSLESFPPTDDKDPFSFFHGSGLVQQQPNTNSLTFSHQQQQQQPPYNNFNIGLLPHSRKGSPFSCTDSTIRSHAAWPLINHPAQQLVSRENKYIYARK